MAHNNGKKNSKCISYDKRLGKRFRACHWCGGYSNIDYRLLVMKQCAFEHSACPSCFDKYNGFCPACWINHPARKMNRRNIKRYYKRLGNSEGKDYLARIKQSAREQFKQNVLRFAFLRLRITKN